MGLLRSILYDWGYFHPSDKAIGEAAMEDAEASDQVLSVQKHLAKCRDCAYAAPYQRFIILVKREEADRAA